MPNLEQRLARLEKMIKAGVGIDIVNLLDATAPQPKKNSIQYNSAGEVWMIDKDGEVIDMSDIFLTTPPPGQPLTEVMDVFLIGGQSNASGKGVNTSSPNPQANTVYQWATTFSMVTDEVSGANTGSAWPSFGIAWNHLTGRKICFVPAAVEASAQVAAADLGSGNWDTSGALYASAVSKLQSALTDIAAAGYVPVLRGILWSQGETDAIGINAATIIQSDYTTALTTMVANFRTVFGSDLQFYMFQTGTRTDHSDTGYASIRSAQATFVATDPLRNRMVFRGAFDFVARSLMIDTVHYSQAGYNEMGRLSAEIIVSGMDWGFQRVGTSGVYVPGTNKLGVNNSNPTDFIHVKGGAFDATLINASGNTNQALANIKVENLSTGTSAAAGIRFFNDGGIRSQLLLYSGTASNPGANVLLLHTVPAAIRLASNSGDLEFATGSTAIANVKSKMFNNGQWVFNVAGTPTRTNTTAALIELQSTTQGFAPPEMTKAQRDAIVAPFPRLMIYQTDNTPGLRVYNGTNWMRYTETAD